MKLPAWASRPGLTALAKRKSVWAGLGGVSGMAAGVGATALLLTPGHPASVVPSAPPATPGSAASPSPSVTAGQFGKGFRVIVPSIGANAPVVPAGAVDGALNVPSSVHQVVWWDGAAKDSATGATVDEKVASPGQSGVALLAGHIDSRTQGRGVFYELSKVKPGASITVIDSRQKVTHWKVTRVQTVFKSTLPSGLFVNQGAPRLALVSCGGPFDSATGHYLDNIIAWAVPA